MECNGIRVFTYDDDDRKLNETVSYPTPNGTAYSLSYGYHYNLARDGVWLDASEAAQRLEQLLAEIRNKRLS